MSKNLEPQLIPATGDDYSTIQNLARFYVYDMSRYCGFLPDWECPEDGLYEAYDFKSYFIEKDRYPFLIRVNNELAGFVLVNKVGFIPDIDWNVGEFFITAKFQHRGIGQKIAQQLWQRYPGKWQVSVLPQNESGLQFWRKTINKFTKNQFNETTKKVAYDANNPRIIFSFTT
ncbi:GNAT family N-acetyltransferase [Legionella micdadei]|uniref:GCN5-related N-acetyltransferase n=1 Tax=Legionella micdadei TaxID=451 RepID=A0A098GBT7_LEGMI|nr:GNAT family N-acetyltransferase [Legionella micdadei]ARG98372.1 GNAT family N-acetyltransferase [Legionella micdadei]ARH01122.1 GNAT family N-acetyltransferase [Legionella micdadei]KTD27305.1 GNAT family acetyltransferase [Legionella micdadei]NSL18689.1 GNAT family N-acetyltransferase [Legionella micdadei]CEG59954.1 GCN5-related N-acetyltransferase [Legionella micdadei]